MPKNSEIAVIGAGFAGAATAYFLYQAGVRDCVVLEAEELPGMRASGVNAALGRQIIADLEFRAMAMEGMRFLRHPPVDFSASPLIDNRGSLLVFSAADRNKTAGLEADATRDGLTLERLDSKKFGTYMPFLRDIDSALFCPGDGVMDIHALLCGFLHPLRHEDRLVTSARVTGISRRAKHWKITTTAGTWTAETIVNAAGAWAAEIAALAGAETIPLEVRRRHLFVTVPTTLLDPSAPFVWDVSHSYYFRPESGGIMLSPCDESTTTPDAAFQTTLEAEQQLFEKLERYCPAFVDIPISRFWAGARTFGPYDKLILKWDSKAPRFFWIAGLGGHGATCSAAIGQRASQMIHEGPHT